MQYVTRKLITDAMLNVAAIRVGHHRCQPLMSHLGVSRHGMGELRAL